MTDKARYDPDKALAALVRAERAAQPPVSDRLRARVLADAAEVAAARPAEAPASPARSAAAPGWLDWLRGRDLSAGAAIAAAILCLVIGLGIGYGAGDLLLAEAGFEEMRVAEADEEEAAALLLSEDVL